MSAESNIKVGDRARLKPGLHPMQRTWGATKGCSAALPDGAEITLLRPADHGTSWYFTHPDLGGAERVVDREKIEPVPAGEVEFGDRVRFSYPGHPEHGKSGRVNRDFRPDYDQVEVAVEDNGKLLRSRPCYLERLPDPTQAESDLMTRLEEGVEPPVAEKVEMTFTLPTIQPLIDALRGQQEAIEAILGPEVPRGSAPSVQGTAAGAVAWAQADPELRRVNISVGGGKVDVYANLAEQASSRHIRFLVPFSADAVSCFLDGMMMEPDRGLCVTVNRSAEVA